MTGKFAIRSILAVSLGFMLSVISSTASALVDSTTTSGCNLITHKNKLGQPCSIFVEALLKQLQNVSNNPTAFTATLSNLSGRIFCKNPASMSFEGNGTPFNGEDVFVTGGATIAPATVTKNGRSLKEIVIHDPEIISALAQAGFSVSCVNPQWIQVIVITAMQVTGKQLRDDDPLNNNDGCFLPATGELIVGGCTIVDTLRTSCRIQDPYFTDPVSAINAGFYSYGAANTGTGDCTEICHSADPSLCSPTIP